MTGEGIETAALPENGPAVCGPIGGQPRLSLLWVNHFAVAPDLPGGTRHFELGRQLVREHGWSVTIAAADYHYQSRRYTRRSSPSARGPIMEVIDGVRFRWLWSAPYVRNNWRRASNWLSFTQSLLRQTDDIKYDVVIGSSPHLFAAWGAYLLARRHRVPYVLEVRDLWPESLLAAGGRKDAGYGFLWLLSRYLYRRADRIICLAKGTAKQLTDYGVDERKLAYVPNGTAINGHAQHDAPVRSGFTLLYAGAHGPANGLEVVLDAAQQLAANKSIRFVLAGDGPAKASLMAKAISQGLTNVEFRDPVPKSRLHELFASADAALMVLRDTPLFAFGVSPNKLFDYFGAGLPVVCNVPGDVARMVAEAAAGVQAKDGSASALVTAINALTSKGKAELIRMGVSARAWVAREHSREALAVRLDSALRNVINK